MIHRSEFGVSGIQVSLASSEYIHYTTEHCTLKTYLIVEGWISLTLEDLSTRLLISNDWDS